MTDHLLSARLSTNAHIAYLSPMFAEYRAESCSRARLRHIWMMAAIVYFLSKESA